MIEPVAALVLGGTSGIGLAVNKRLREMLPVYAYGRENFDIRNAEALAVAVEESRPSHVVYSIGVNYLDWVGGLDERHFNRLITINVWGFVRTIQALKDAACGPCSVVAISSDAARRPMRTSLAYCASKAALEMAVRVASRELAGEGWRINAVAPGKVEGTAMTEYVDGRVLALRGWSKEFAEEYELSSSPIHRKLTVEEVADVTADVLLSDSQAWTGDVVTVNGGR